MLTNRLKPFLRYYAGISILFALAYLPANRLSEFRSDVAIVALPWEPGIPFVSWMILPYLSILLLFWAPLFFLEQNRIRQLAINMAWVTVVCGLIFTAIPTTVAYVRPEEGSGLLTLFQLFYLFDQPYNAFPSLHIAYSYLCTSFIVSHSSVPGRHLFILWFFLIALSVLLIHQHHIADIVAAILLVHLIRTVTERRIPG